VFVYIVSAYYVFMYDVLLYAPCIAHVC